jgi:hypothetical protein
VGNNQGSGSDIEQVDTYELSTLPNEIVAPWLPNADALQQALYSPQVMETQETWDRGVCAIIFQGNHVSLRMIALR